MTAPSPGYYVDDRLGKRRFGESRNVIPARTSKYAHHGPYVPAETIRRLIQPLIDEIGLPTVADLSGVGDRQLRSIMTTQKVVGLTAADRLITDALDDPGIWYREEGLDFVKHNGKPL